MPKVFSVEIIQLVIFFTILAILIAVAIYVVRLLHEKSVQKELNTEELLNNFRELKSQGKLSESEFRIIKKQLASQIVQEEKNKSQNLIDPVVLIAQKNTKTQNNDLDDFSNFLSNNEDTQIAGYCDNEGNDNTVFNR
ncbi:MAG: hypothetical protein LBC20_07690 [Planctomycetaceae bacterium]|jgi:hypothetical protein|nr:hypothetical protein [Planctomycetaceae bacterium]